MTNNPPHAPMPPGMAYPVDDQYHQPSNVPMYHDDANGGTVDGSNPKKSKKPKVHELVEKELIGYVLELAPAKAGEKKCWQRVGKRALPLEQQKLESMVLSNRKSTGRGPAHDLALLTSAQKGVINRLIAEHKVKEKNPNADWVLVDVQRFKKRKPRLQEVKEIQVILKRYDRSLNKPRDTAINPNLGGYQECEIIDLAEPTPEPKPEKKKNKPKKSSIHEFNFDDPQTLNVPNPQDHPPGDPVHQQHGGYVQDSNAQQGWQDQFHSPQHQPNSQYLDPMNHDPYGRPPQLPTGAVPVDAYSARQTTGSNPFTPYPEFMSPHEQYNSNVLNNPADANQYPQRPAARTPPAPPPPERRSSSHQRSNSAARLRDALERERADNAELQAKLERLNLNQRPLSDHSNGTRYSNGSSVFSQYPVGEAFTPPSTPPRSDYYEPRRSPHRRRSGELREARYGAKRYGDESVDLRAGYTARDRSREAMQRYRRSPPRSVVLHRPEHDDYPREPLCLPAFTPRVQRRLTNGGQGYHSEATFTQAHRRRQEERRRGTAYEQLQRPDRMFGDERYI